MSVQSVVHHQNPGHFTVRFGSQVRFAEIPDHARSITVNLTPAPDIFAPQTPDNTLRLFLHPEKLSVLPSGEVPAEQARTITERLQFFLENLHPDADIPGVGAIARIFKTVKQETNKDKIQSRKTRTAIVAEVQKVLGKLPPSVQHLEIVLPSNLPSKLSKAKLLGELAEEVSLLGRNTNIFREDKTHPRAALQTITLSFANPSTKIGKKLNASLAEGHAIGQGRLLAQYMVQAHANEKTSAHMLEIAKSLSSETLKVKSFEKADLETERMGLFLAVGKGNRDGSANEPRMAEMVYTAPDFKEGDPDCKTVLLVGKGVLFDTGGINLKYDAAGMKGMKGDMAGSAAVIGAMKVIDQQKPRKIRVVALTPFTENRAGNNAMSMEDKYTSRKGLTVEITNTDAEGRLCLADAVNYGTEKYNPDLTVDIATLTGAKLRALGGKDSIGLVGNNMPLLRDLANLEKGLSRQIGAVPVTQNLINWISWGGKGTKANLRNAAPADEAHEYKVIPHKFDAAKPGNNQFPAMLAGFAQGGTFIYEAGLHDPKKNAWVHMDIAGADMDDKGNATGFGVKDLYHIVKAVSTGTLKPDASKNGLATQKQYQKMAPSIWDAA